MRCVQHLLKNLHLRSISRCVEEDPTLRCKAEVGLKDRLARNRWPTLCPAELTDAAGVGSTENGMPRVIGGMLVRKLTVHPAHLVALAVALQAQQPLGASTLVRGQPDLYTRLLARLLNIPGGFPSGCEHLGLW